MTDDVRIDSRNELPADANMEPEHETASVSDGFDRPTPIREDSYDTAGNLIIKPEDQELLVDSDQFRCRQCGGEVAWFCEMDQSGDPSVPVPCGCEKRPQEGLCRCDHWVCTRCGLLLDAQVAGRKVQISGGTIIPMAMKG